MSIDHRSWKAARHLGRLARSAAAAALQSAAAEPLRFDLSVRFASDAAVARLNKRWRTKNAPTNVLSFPARPPHDGRFLGDIILASGVIRREAKEQGKSLSDHAAHLIVHGVLHLLGHDHHEARSARRMERMEIRALHMIGIADPYRPDEAVS